jgi:hypothetical protein
MKKKILGILVVILLIGTTTISVAGQIYGWETTSYDTDNDTVDDCDVRIHRNDNGEIDIIHIDLNKDGVKDEGEVYLENIKILGCDMCCGEKGLIVDVAVDEPDITDFSHWKWQVYDKDGDGDTDDEGELIGLRTPAAYNMYDPALDLIHIYSGEPVSEGDYVGYLDIIEAYVLREEDSVDYHFIVKGGIPVLEYATFYTVLVDFNNYPGDNCGTYPLHNADTMFSLNLRTAILEKSSYQILGGWWMVEDTAASFSLISAWPNGDTEIIISIPYNEITRGIGMIPWRIMSDSNPAGIGDFVPNTGMMYLPFSDPFLYVLDPYDGKTISGEELLIRAVESTFYFDRCDMIGCIFEYAHSFSGPWLSIDMDYFYTDGWEVLWDISGLTEGVYYLRARMWDAFGVIGQSNVISVFYDPTPPFPEFSDYEYNDWIADETYLWVDTSDENVDFTDFYYIMENNSKEKNVPKVCQKYIKSNTGNDPHNGGYSCGPCAAAACLGYWDQYKDGNGNKPYDALYDETKKDGNDDGDKPDGLEQMARDLYDSCKTNTGGKKGTNGRDMEAGLNKYIKDKGLDAQLKADFDQTITWNDAKDAFHACKDVILLIKRPDGSLHWITLCSIEKVQEEDGTEKVYVGWMEPWCGYEAGGFIEDGKLMGIWDDTAQNKPAEFIDMVTVSQTGQAAANCVDPYIGRDTDGSDGWGINWDTLQVPDGHYLITAYMTDKDNNVEDNGIVLYVGNMDETSPELIVNKPLNSLYLFDQEIVTFPISLVIGEITIEVEAWDVDSGIRKVEFYIDDELKTTDTSSPYEWLWDETIFGQHIIKVIPYDNAGNTVTDEIIVWKLF